MTVEASPGGRDDHHALTAHEVLLVLGTDPAQGLSHDEARRRLEQYGPNRLPAAAGGTAGCCGWPGSSTTR